MEYEIIRNEDDELSVYLPYKNLFDETYNPDGYEEFPEIEIVFKDTEDKKKPSKQQMKALEYFIQHSFELSEFISDYIFNEREVLLEKGFQIEEVKEAKKNYRFSTIYIDDEHRDKFSFIGMTGICSWDEEHGFGVVLLKKEIIDFGDWNCGYTMYSSKKEEKFSLAEENMLEPLTNRRKKISELSENIEIDNVDDYLSLLKWLIDLKVVYGYRKTKLDLNNKEIIALIQSLEELDLSNKKLESLHENFYLLSNLKELNLSNNNFTELPESLNQLDLQTLIFKNNQLCNLPQSFFKLKNLCRLFLNDNKFTEAPELLGDLEKLTSLELSNNNLSSLPNSYKNLTELTYFSIANNKFDLFPEVIKYWKHLQVLY
ncbi:MAG: leucine-rich repeat domain-containing protein, partial [Pedobacter sp.]